jgi:hypothetical protein
MGHDFLCSVSPWVAMIVSIIAASAYLSRAMRVSDGLKRFPGDPTAERQHDSLDGHDAQHTVDSDQDDRLSVVHMEASPAPVQPVATEVASGPDESGKPSECPPPHAMTTPEAPPPAKSAAITLDEAMRLNGHSLQRLSKLAGVSWRTAREAHRGRVKRLVTAEKIAQVYRSKDGRWLVTPASLMGIAGEEG